MGGVREAYVDDLVGDSKMTRPLKVVFSPCNGTPAAPAPEPFERNGVEDVTTPTNPHYLFLQLNPQP